MPIQQRRRAHLALGEKFGGGVKRRVEFSEVMHEVECGVSQRGYVRLFQSRPLRVSPGDGSSDRRVETRRSTRHFGPGLSGSTHSVFTSLSLLQQGPKDGLVTKGTAGVDLDSVRHSLCQSARACRRRCETLAPSLRTAS